MKKTASFLFAVAIMIATPFVLYSCSENDEEGHTSNNQTGTPETIVPDLNKENIPFVGEWSGWGPYRASGTSASKYGLVKGIWKFYNDGTYYWSCTNSYGYPYTEKGSWHYIPESKLLVTDGSCGLSWEIEDISENQWIGTIQARGESHMYTKTDTDIATSDVEIIDYGTNRLSVQSTIKNIKFANQSFKLGVCYGDKDNLYPDTYTKIYADSVNLNSGVFNIDITCLDEGKYRLRSFIELEDGTSKFGNEYKAVCIKPLDNYVFLGETNEYMWVWFYSKSALLSNGSHAPIGTYGDKIDFNNINDLFEGKAINPMSKEEMDYLATLPMEIKTHDNDGKKYIHISSMKNSNELVLPFYDYPSSRWYYTSMIHSGERLLFRFYENGKSIRLGSDYRTDNNAYVLPVMRYTVRWN